MNKNLWSTRTAHTLVEMLMVIFIMALLASMIVPRYDLQRKRTAVNATKANLEIIRTAIAVYYEAEGAWPSNSLFTLVTGSPSGTKYLGKIPQEEIKAKNNVVNTPDYAGGWYHDLILHAVHPNLSGNDVNGLPYSSY